MTPDTIALLLGFGAFGILASVGSYFAERRYNRERDFYNRAKPRKIVVQWPKDYRLQSERWQPSERTRAQD